MLTRIKNAWWALRQSPNISLDQLDQLIELADIGEKSSAGIRVNEREGTRQDTVYSCINILSRDMSALPLKLYERQANGGRAEVTSHPVARWLKSPNGAMTAMQYRQLGWAATLAAGNQYSQVMVRAGEIETWPLSPGRIDRIFLGPDNRKRYEYTKPDGTPGFFTADEILHVYGLSFGSFLGVSPIRWCMETIGRALAVGEYAAAYFRSPTPKVILTHPTGFESESARDDFVDKWNQRFAGKKGLSTVAVLPNGMAVGQIVKIPNDEAQFIETAKLSKEQIAQIYLVPMHRLQALDRATFSNIEHQDLEYAKYSLKPWLTAQEQAIEKQFLTPAERNRLFVRHNLDELLRGDFKTRMEGHSTAIMAGFETINEARALENRPAIDGGDEPIIPMNMGRLSALDEPPEPEPAPGEPQGDDEDDDARAIALNLRAGVQPLRIRAAVGRKRLAGNFQGRIARALATIVSADARAVRRKLEESLSLLEFMAWVEQYFGERQGPTRQAVERVFTALASDAADMAAREIKQPVAQERIDGLAGAYGDRFSMTWRDKSVAQMQNTARDAVRAGDEFEPAVLERLEGWEKGDQGVTRAVKAARREAFGLVNAVARMVFTSAGFSLVWITFGENCPYCDSLAGKRVGGGESFVPQGEFNPAGASRPIKLRAPALQPPIHAGCDCGLGPG